MRTGRIIIIAVFGLLILPSLMLADDTSTVPFEITLKDASKLSNIYANSQFSIEISVKNRGTEVFDRHRFFVSYHWFDAAGEKVVWDGIRTQFPHSLKQNQETTLKARILSPNRSGTFILLFDIVHEGVRWIGNVLENGHEVVIDGSIIEFAGKYNIDSVNKNSSIFIDLSVTNNSGSILSGSSSEFISYHIFNEDGSLYLWDGKRTPITQPILPDESRSYRVKFTAPGDPGKYYIQWNVVREGKMWVLPIGNSDLIGPIVVRKGFLHYLQFAIPLIIVAFCFSYIFFSIRRKKPFRRNIYLLFILIILSVVIGKILVYEPDKNGMWADQATHIMSAYSLAYDCNIKYEVQDIKRFKDDTDWNRPAGLFLNKDSEGVFYFSKPVIFAALSAPFVRMFGPRGPIVLNFALLLTMVGSLYAVNIKRGIGRLNSSIIASLLLLSPAYIYVFPIHPDLTIASLIFFAVLSWMIAYNESIEGVFTNSKNKYKSLFLYLSMLFFGLSMYEKLPFGMILLLVSIYTSIFYGLKKGAALFIGSIAVFMMITSVHIFTIGEWSPYRGDRFGCLNSFPFFDETYRLSKANSSDKFDIFKLLGNGSFVISNLHIFLKDYLFGRHIGVIPYFGAGFIYFLLSIRFIKKYRTTALIVCCYLSYTLFCFFLNPNNYYGGSHSFGNRYFLQIFPLILLPQCHISKKITPILIGLTISMVIIMGNAFSDPGGAIKRYWKYARKSSVNRIFPYESSTALIVSLDNPNRKCHFNSKAKEIIVRVDGEDGFTEQCKTIIKKNSGAKFLIRIEEKGLPPRVEVFNRNENGDELVIDSITEWKKTFNPFNTFPGYYYAYYRIDGDKLLNDINDCWFRIHYR